MSTPQRSHKRPTVILRACEEYDPDRVEQIVGEGLDLLKLRPSGRVLVKPNVVASGTHFPHAFTRPEFMEGVLKALKARGQEVTEFAVGERCGITIPTRFAFDQAGYYPMLDRVGGVLAHHFDEVPQVPIPLYHKDRLRDVFYTPEPVAKADFFVNCPKFKAHPWTTVTFSMKNYIGIQDDRHRLLDHDHKLDQKVADLQYIIQPQFIAIDAITAGEGRMLTPLPFDMGMIVMGDNQIAVDAVCCRIIGIDPMEVAHLRLAWERGFGSMDMADIDVVGDVSLDAARERASTFKSGLIRVEDYFQGSSIRAYSGRPPGDEVDYCWGGCPGALEEAIEIMRIFDAATDEKLPTTHIVFGKYEGPIDASAGEKVIFIGDCASFKGEIAGNPVEVRSQYVDRSRKGPLTAKSSDIFAKMASVGINMWQSRNEQVLRLSGCPVSVAEQVLTLVSLGKLKNPYLDPANTIPFTNAYLSWRSRSALNRLLGDPYNRLTPVVRGKSRPTQNLPPEGSTSEWEAE